MGNKLGKILFIIVYIPLTVFQVLTTNVKEAYTDTPYQIDLQIQRMNSYPPHFEKVGYALEVKREIQFLRKIERNFFQAVDLDNYFPERLPYILSPLFFVGLYVFVDERSKNKIMFYGFLLSVVILSAIGSHALYGPVLMMSFFILFLILGVKKLLGLLLR